MDENEVWFEVPPLARQDSLRQWCYRRWVLPLVGAFPSYGFGGRPQRTFHRTFDDSLLAKWHIHPHQTRPDEPQRWFRIQPLQRFQHLLRLYLQALQLVVSGQERGSAHLWGRWREHDKGRSQRVGHIGARRFYACREPYTLPKHQSLRQLHVLVVRCPQPYAYGWLPRRRQRLRLSLQRHHGNLLYHQAKRRYGHGRQTCNRHA